MSFKIVLQDTDEGLEVRILRQIDTMKEVCFYIFTRNNGIKTEHTDSLKDKFNIYIGNEYKKAFLCHLGSHQLSVMLGNEASRDLDKQRKLLVNFIKELPNLSGEYGSWWTKTQALMDSKLTYYRAYKFSIYYLTGSASQKPLEWEQESFDKWLKNHQSGLNVSKEPFKFNLICRDATINPFFNESKHPVSVETLDKFLSADTKDADTQIIDLNKALTLQITLNDEDKTIMPINKSGEWKFLKQRGKKCSWQCQKPELKDYFVCVLAGITENDLERFRLL